jgi:hypothetical protein
MGKPEMLTESEIDQAVLELADDMEMVDFEYEFGEGKKTHYSEDEAEKIGIIAY